MAFCSECGHEVIVSMEQVRDADVLSCPSCRRLFKSRTMVPTAKLVAQRPTKNYTEDSFDEEDL